MTNSGESALSTLDPSWPRGFPCGRWSSPAPAARPLFAALDIPTGEIFAQCKRRHRHQEFLAFLRDLDTQVPAPLALHLILANYGTHKHRKVKAWLARHPRVHRHFTPTYASWLNQVERWFALITPRAIRRGSVRQVRELIERIERFVERFLQPDGTALPMGRHGR